jgi:hypothetical protein
VVQGGSEVLKKTCREAQTRIPCLAVLNFRWFLESGSDVVQGGSYISHLPPIHKSVKTVRGFLANQGRGGSLAGAHAGLCVPSALHPGVLQSHVTVRAKNFPRTWYTMLKKSICKTVFCQLPNCEHHCICVYVFVVSCPTWLHMNITHTKQ